MHSDCLHAGGSELFHLFRIPPEERRIGSVDSKVVEGVGGRPGAFQHEVGMVANGGGFSLKGVLKPFPLGSGLE